MESQATWKDPSNRIRLVGGLNRFAFRLFQQLCEEQPCRNLFLSPSSVATALAMTHLGASGDTRDELASLLGYSMPEEKRRKAFRELAESTRTGGVEFRSANRLWGQNSYHFLRDFLNATQEDFGAALGRVDFADDAEGACLEINKWAEEQTNGRIKDLVPPGLLGPMTRLVLTNAVYFLGTWQTPFEKDETREADFFHADGATANVPTMYQAGQFSYGESNGVKVLQLPYRSYGVSIEEGSEEDLSFALPNEEGGSDFAMEVLLPSAGEGVGDVAKLLASEGLQGLPSTDYRKVYVYLPRFRVESTFSMGRTLSALGVKRAFSVEHADFSSMSDNSEGLFISEVAHKAFVDVNEEGTEAAAATAILLAGAGYAECPPPVEFKADHPFIFLIRDAATGLVHFIGRLEEPQTE
ncbi:MAG: serpin family protein [Planctomycetales bacterium]|nr:serpin family protein [Planctomycetales bacterium]